MKKVFFIGNRINVLKELLDAEDLSCEKIYAVQDSYLAQFLGDKGIAHRTFTLEEKSSVIADIASSEYEILVSNGCPFVLPVSEVPEHEKKLFLNVHPSFLPDLRGINPINGIFLEDYPYLAATVHFMDEGIDTGNIVHQEKVPRTEDIDLGLAYFISFELEGIAMRKALELLRESDFTFKGYPQQGKGSYYTRKDAHRRLDFSATDPAELMRKIEAFNLSSQGAYLERENKRLKLLDPQIVENPFLLERFQDREPGEIVKEYEGKLLIKTIDGLIKINRYDSEPIE